MTLIRTPLTLGDATTKVNVEWENEIKDQINNTSANAVDKTDGLIDASSVTIDADATVNGDRSLIFKLTSSLSRIFKYASGTGRMRLEDQAGSLVALEVADATQDTQAVTKGQLTTAMSITNRSVTGADTAVEGDKNSLLRCSGTFTLALTTAATLTTGWFCMVTNTGTGPITIDPAGSETIDGVSSIIAQPSDCFYIIRTSSSTFRTVGRQQAGSKFIGSATVSGSSQLAIGGLSQDKIYRIAGLIFVATDGVDVLFRTGTSGTTLDAGGSDYNGVVMDTTSATAANAVEMTRVGLGNATREHLFFEATLTQKSGEYPMVKGESIYMNASTGAERVDWGGFRVSTTAMTLFGLQASGGNITGTIWLEEMRAA